MNENEKTVGWQPLQEFATRIFMKLGMPQDDAETEARVLIWANLRGLDSHGIMKVALYTRNVDTGLMKPKPEIRVEKETPATLLIEADRAFGPVVTVFAMDRVIAKASQVGIGWALIRNTTHQGAMGYYPLIAAERGMAGLAFVCSPPNAAAYGSRAAGVAANPIAMSVPGKRHRPLILDMAQTVQAGGKISLAIDKGTRIPEGWALDDDGNPTTDPLKATVLLPFGGPKGSGLSLMLETLSSVMAGNPLLEPAIPERDEPPAETNTTGPSIGIPSRFNRRPVVQNSVVAAVNISAFSDVEAYREHIDRFIDGIKSLPKAEGFEEIAVPGELEWRVYDERMRNGIPIHEGTLQNLRSIARRFDVPVPPGF